MEALRIPATATQLWNDAIEPIAELFGGWGDHARWALGGGTVLAMRWGEHRMSTDLDIVVFPDQDVTLWTMHAPSNTALERMTNMAIAQRRPQGVIHHSDKGAQYTSLAFGKRCRDRGIVTSTGSAGDCYDNAMAESFFATLECEPIDRRSFQTQAEARMAIFEFIEGWYNTKRRHSGLGYLSPNEFERRTAATVRQAQDDARGRDRTGLEPCQIGRPAIHNHPLGEPSTPVSQRDSLPQAIVHLSAGGDSPQPSTESG